MNEFEIRDKLKTEYHRTLRQRHTKNICEHVH